MNDLVVAFIEIPGGSRNKYEVDEESGHIFLDRMLFTATRYPADYGYIPETLAGDGDPLDILVLVGEPTFPGCRIRVRPIGVFLMEDSGESDHKVIAVPAGDPRWAEIQAIEDLDLHLRQEIQHFFEVYKMLEGSATTVLGWRTAEEASEVIAAARAAYAPT